MKTWIFDIDGTLANIEHRRHFVTSKPKNWPAFNAAMINDGVNEPVVEFLLQIFSSGGTIILASGRSEEQRLVTTQWLRNNNIPWHRLYMRAEKDYRSDDIVKEEILAQIRADGFEPFAVVDDRPQVVRMWRRNGIFVFDVNQSGEEF